MVHEVEWMLRSLGLLFLLVASPLSAQAPGPWNDEQSESLMARARERRLAPQADTTLHNYSARAEGFVYFYLDRNQTDERTLVKTDQIALELYWSQPDLTKQRIVGLRDQSQLPNRMHYHLDHLTVVQNGFGNMIRLGDGDEVRDVPHPAAPGSDAIYDFRVVDSLELRLPGAPAPIRVYELNVRPKRNDRPALVGSVFLDRGSADIVRMTFTFTPVSYVDRRLDYIQISLDNGLWNGRYWLPNEQRLEIRRQIPELDFAAGAVIMGRMRITDYTFNDSLPRSLFAGSPVEALPPAVRENYPFERAILDDLEEAGLASPPELEDLRARAAALLRARRLSGLPPFRFYLPSASSALRYNRSEGLFLGGGATYAPGTAWRVDGTLGYAFGAEHLAGGISARRGGSLGGELALSAYANDARDLGIALPVAPAFNTLSAVFLGDDYLDPYYSSGARIGWRRGDAWQLGLSASAERHRTATLAEATPPFDDSALFRAVRPIDEGDQYALAARLARPLPDGALLAWSMATDVAAGTLAGEAFARLTTDLGLRLRSAGHTRSLELRGRAGVTTANTATQHLFLLGGVGTLPGHDYRAFGGRRFGLLEVEATQELMRPWVRLRALAAAGAAGGLAVDPERAWSSWDLQPTDGVKASAGAGVSLFWDILRVDYVRGLGSDGRWVVQLSASPAFADIS